jgi:hypothetical protein
VQAQLSGQTTTNSIDFNIPLIDTSLKITEFHRSFYIIWLNFKIYMLNLGIYVGIVVESDGLAGWLDDFGVDLAKTNMKWYKDPLCINIAKNQFIFIAYKNSTDCFSQVMIKFKGWMFQIHQQTNICCAIIFQM